MGCVCVGGVYVWVVCGGGVWVCGGLSVGVWGMSEIAYNNIFFLIGLASFKKSSLSSKIIQNYTF